MTTPGGSGWGNPLVGGTVLRYPAIQSPNFSLVNKTGWYIDSQGNAYFFNITATGTITSTTVIVQGSTGGIFVYSGTPALGNLIVSIAGMAGTDGSGNAYPQGVNVTTGTISGSTISSSTFTGSDFILNSNGLFVYNGTPANGNMIASIAATAGTDGFGNAYQATITSYSSPTDYVQITSDFITLFKSGLFQGQQLLATGNAITQLSSGLQSNVDTAANVIAESASAAGGSSTINLSAAVTNVLNALNISGVTTFNGNWTMGGSAEFGGPAGSGPFIAGEVFHTVTLVTGLTGNLSGGVGVRVKLLPWNAVWLDVHVSWTTTSATTFTLGGSFPSSAYYPNVTRIFPMNQNGTPSGIASAMPRIFIPTSGSPQIVVPSSSAGGTAGVSMIFPTN